MGAYEHQVVGNTFEGLENITYSNSQGAIQVVDTSYSNSRSPPLVFADNIIQGHTLQRDAPSVVVLSLYGQVIEGAPHRVGNGRG